MSAIAEDILLLANTHHDTHVFTEPDELSEILVGGCLVVEALLSGALHLDERRRFSPGPHDVSAQLDPLVERAARHATSMGANADHLTDDERWMADVAFPIQAAAEVTDRLRATGAIRAQEQKRFGRRATTVDVAQPRALDALTERMRAVMIGGATPDPVTGVALLLTAVCGTTPELPRGERKRWAERSEALFTSMYWMGDAGTPAEPIPGIDDHTRRMIGDVVVPLGVAYQMGVASEILAALEHFRRGF
ncbi:MAG: GPP34 family phosphoprotein [Acidimicrobiales bacterium]|nr:GPP34 family phosphoprotein [Acidimicrobiales bacterium]